MNSVFINQTWLEIILTSGVDITGATEHLIKYRKPNGTVGSLEATVENAASGVLKYVVPVASTLIDQKGEWKFWNHVTFVDGRVARGESYSVKFYSDQQ